MSDAAAPAAAAPAPSAPTATSSPTTAPTSAPTGNAPAPPSGLQQAPAAPVREPIPWKTKAKVGDAEHEVELDVSPFLEGYKRKVKLDGEEVEVSVEEALRGYERKTPSLKRFEEASKLRKEAEAERAQTAEYVKRVEGHLTNPATALPVMKKALGPRYLPAVMADLKQAVMSGDRETIESFADIVRERREYEGLTPEARQQRDRMSESERRAAEREAQLVARERELEQRAQQTQAAEQQRAAAEKAARIEKMTQEIAPQLEAAGLPVRNDDGSIDRAWVREFGKVMRHASDNGIPMSVADGIAETKARHDRLFARSLARHQASQLQAIQEQPGRTPPTPPKEPPRAGNGRFQSKDAPQSLEALRAELRARR